MKPFILSPPVLTKEQQHERLICFYQTWFHVDGADDYYCHSGDFGSYCVSFIGNARGVLGDKYTIKAVACDVSKEPRVLLINQDQTVRICQSSRSRCDNKEVFSGGNNIDQECELLH